MTWSGVVTTTGVLPKEVTGVDLTKTAPSRTEEEKVEVPEEDEIENALTSTKIMDAIALSLRSVPVPLGAGEHPEVAGEA